MLSRAEDARVFTSSDDVILRPSSRSYSHKQQLRPDRRRHHSTVAPDPEEADEDEQLHPQHPYRMRKRVLHTESDEDFHPLVDRQASDGHALVTFSRQESNRPMEFVFLSSGEIRAREDCPTGLGLPKLQQQTYSRQGTESVERRLEYQGAEQDSDSDEDSDEEDVHRTQTSRRSRREAPAVAVAVARQRSGRPVSSPSSSSGRSVSESEDADVSSDGDSEYVAMAFTMDSEDREMHAGRRSHSRPVTRNAESRIGRRRGLSERSSVKNTPTRSLKMDHLRIEEQEEVTNQAEDRSSAAQHMKAYRKEKAPTNAATSRETRQRPAPLDQVSQTESTHDASTRRTKRSPKMEVSRLVTGEAIAKTKSRTTSSKVVEEEMLERLGAELQNEKKRVLEKMTQLLDEQGKNQQLRDQVEALETQLAAKDSEMITKLQEAARSREEQIQLAENERTARLNALEEQVRLQEAKIARLKHDKNQLKTAVKQLKTMGADPSNGRGSDDNDVEALRAELYGVTQRLHEFLAKVERWKSSSKERMQACDRKTDLSALLEHVWTDFPQFSGVAPLQHKGGSSLISEQQQQPAPVADEQADVVVFLKKRLRQREDELRQTHVKYVELKELCARQCVREADLQNFINEHRLRGNLIIRKNSSTKPNDVADNQDQVQDNHQDEHQHNAKLKMISSRGTNTPSLFQEREENEANFVNDEYSNNQGDNDDYGEEDEEEYEYPVRTPKIFVQVGRDGVYEHASPTDSALAQKLASDRSRGKRKSQAKQQRVERIRLVPSPSLAQRYERVPTPTTGAPRRKKSAQQPVTPQSSSRSHPALLGECPPGCGSRPSFTRKKAPSIQARTKPAKRPVTTSASKGAIGVIRPWM
ncbi:hypothetical protein PF008_g19085 [Phytophthora fragariae]|uniref:Uncharacterized protein n=1 Tax=Phytophthora fragariae TaxID=53985 RepID=A0A6G0R4R4_9STRA|nr:hypothetical protein PF008_g19085 [Phytophthora fragariae]